MKRYKMKTYQKYLIGIPLFLGLSTGASLLLNRYVTGLEDIARKAPLIRTKFERPEQGVWKYYINEEAIHNQIVYHEFLDKVKAENTFFQDWITTDGNINLPDLDRDGKVGEAELYDNKK